MKTVYWRPGKISRRAITMIAALSVAGLVTVERYQRIETRPDHAQKLAAAKLAARSIDLLRVERLRRGYAIDPQLDPTGSGMIGATVTPVTSVTGNLQAKQTSVNPNFAALVVEWLRTAGVGPGDHVAVGCSGSFPTLNVSVCAALETLQVTPVVVSSAAASQYGANLPDFLWVDMERTLVEAGCISFRSQAASLGGYEDKAMGMPAESRTLLREAIRRNQLDLLEADSFTASVVARMQIYRRAAAGAPIKAYINVGGGTVSVGRSIGKKLYLPGLNLEPPPHATEIDSVMTRFAASGVPVIHLSDIKRLAQEHNLAVAPLTLPTVGSGRLYVEQHRNPWLAGGFLALILLVLRAFVLTDAGYRALAKLRRAAATLRGTAAALGESVQQAASPVRNAPMSGSALSVPVVSIGALPITANMATAEVRSVASPGVAPSTVAMAVDEPQLMV